MGLLGRHLSSSPRDPAADINPDCRRMQSLSGPKNLTAPLPARLRNVRLITLIPSRGVPNLGGGRKRNGRNRPKRGLICGGEIQFRRLLPSRSLSLSLPLSLSLFLFLYQVDCTLTYLAATQRSVRARFVLAVHPPLAFQVRKCDKEM